MWEKVYSGFGYWDVYIWLFFFVICAVIILLIRSLGRSDYKEGTEQDEIFYGSNIVPEDGADMGVPAASAYWGFVEALKPYYEWLIELHTGIASEYVGYFMLTMAVVAVLVLL
ncbi:MAG: hydrogenase [Thermovirgaceae bacterium]|jgi:hypothetical protein|nr:hydrogenase [Thermovirga sp.]